MASVNYLPQTLPAREIRVSGTNLFALAAKYLGDATQWNRIAELNGLADPWLTSVTVILIPQPGQSNGGIAAPIVPRLVAQ